MEVRIYENKDIVICPTINWDIVPPFVRNLFMALWTHRQRKGDLYKRDILCTWGLY